MRECAIAIIASVSEGAGPISISGNMIAQSEKAIIGMDHTVVKTGELTAAGAGSSRDQRQPRELMLSFAQAAA